MISFPGKAQGVSFSGQAAPAKPAAADDDDLDLFGDETEEEKAAAEAREATKKESSKKKESGKSSVLLDVKPWDDETDMKKLEEAVRSVQIPGCFQLSNFFAIMPSNAIPFEFGDISNFHYQPVNNIFECEIEVYIDPNLRGSEWLGIVVFMDVIRRGGWIRWGSKAPEDDDYTIWNKKQPHRTDWYNFDHKASHCCLMVLELNEKTCWQYLRDDNNTLHIKICVNTYYKDLYEHGKSWRCGWRMTSIEEVQERCNVKDHFNQLTSPDEVKLPSGLVDKLIGRVP